MLRSRPEAVRRLPASLGTAFLDLLPLGADEGERVGALMARYENLEPQLADACLVYLAQREDIDTVFTLDRRDFSVDRTSARKPFHLVP